MDSRKKVCCWIRQRMPQEIFHDLIDVLEERVPHSNTLLIVSFLCDETIVAPMLNKIYTNAEANEIDFSVNSFIFSDCKAWDVAATCTCSFFCYE